nr:nucleotidyltransferase family protein [Liquorilactobacillus satsumensis]
MQYEKELITLVKRTPPEFTEIFHILDSYQLGKALICGGALRDLVWNTLSKQPTSLLRGNIDVLYGDSAETYEQLLTRRALLGAMPFEISVEFAKCRLKQFTNAAAIW